MIHLDTSYYEPTFYVDEHYLSILKRWALFGGAGMLQRGLKMLTGKNVGLLGAALQPEFLATFLNALPERFKKEAFLHSHTQERFLKTLTKDASGKFNAIGPTVGALLQNYHLRWCPACAKEDIQSIGTAYWRNSHQDTRLLRCQRHNLKLLSTCHRCKRKKSALNELKAPPVEPECPLCSKPLNVCRLTTLTPFQLWLEKLHHLGNYGIQVDRFLLIEKVAKVVAGIDDENQMKRTKHYQSSTRLFINEYNGTKVYENTNTGEIPFEIISSWSQLHIKKVLDVNVVYRPEIYGLLGQAFLDEDERESIFGTFKNGEAVKGGICRTSP
jgi:hypothetical protein